jgi:hypothetical protein
MSAKVHVKAHERDYPKGHKVVVKRTTSGSKYNRKNTEDLLGDYYDRKSRTGKKYHSMTAKRVLKRGGERTIVELKPTAKNYAKGYDINEMTFITRGPTLRRLTKRTQY